MPFLMTWEGTRLFHLRDYVFRIIKMPTLAAKSDNTMNRIFHARIAVGQYLFLILIGLLAVYMLWNKLPLPAALFMLWLVVIIGKLIHTTYTVTSDGKLVLFFGRFSRSKEIPLKDVTSVERASSMQVGRFAVMRYVLVKYGKGRCVALFPVKEAEFIRLLEERRMG